ncbi:SMC-Scp complex subunit ScpB [Thiogranum longum]|jgi:segregation and condensation protein B
MNDQNIKQIVEAVLLAAGKPLSLDNILAVFGEDEKPERDEIRQVIAALQEDYAQRGIELVQVASGYRVQVIQEMEPWVSRLTEEKPARYSRALLETLALVAYRQPITRGEIEDIRGVSVSSSIMKTLQDREWVRIVGHRDVPGRPAMYGTTKQFLDYFNLKGLDDLPTLMELRDIDTINAELDFDLEGESAESPASAPHTEADETGEVSEPEQSVVVAKVGVDASGNSETIH